MREWGEGLGWGNKGRGGGSEVGEWGERVVGFSIGHGERGLHISAKGRKDPGNRGGGKGGE